MRTAERVRTLEEAVDLVQDGAVLYTGGAVLRRKPLALLRALIEAGRRDLHVVTFAGSLDVELLLAADAVTTLSTAYVGLGSLGFAPRFRQTAESGTVEDREHSEWTLLGRLRAAAMGLPFLPTRAGLGSTTVEALGFATVTDPYDAETYTALPPLRPDVALLHAWRATSAGDVQMAWPPEHLWDVDVLAARAARTVIVTVEELVATEDAAKRGFQTRLFGFEVDAVVHAPGGAWPTASPPSYDEDHQAVAAYRDTGDVARLLPAASL